MSFKFALCDKVAICVSDERGVVIGRAEYANAENGYLVRYKAADGQAIESWWGESALQALGSASRVEITKNGSFYVSGIGSVANDKPLNEPTAEVTLPRLGTANTAGHAQISVRVNVDGMEYGNEAVIDGKTESPYTRRMKLFPMLVSAQPN